MKTKGSKWKSVWMAILVVSGGELSSGETPRLTDFSIGSETVVVRGTGEEKTCYELQWAPALAGETAIWTHAGETTEIDGEFELVDNGLLRPGFYRVAEKGNMSAGNILELGLNEGMDTYNRFLWANHIISPPANSDYDVFLSGDAFTTEHTFGGTVGKDLDLLSLEHLAKGEVACTWIPHRYWDAPVEDAKWVHVTAKVPELGNRKTIVGRYAYACFDMSGGLDANLLGCTAAKNNDADIVNNRTNIANIPATAFRILSDIKPGQASRLNAEQEVHGNFNSLYDLAANATTTVYPDKLDNLVPYSMSVFRGSIFDPGNGSWIQPRPSDEISQDEWVNYLSTSTEDAFRRINAANLAMAIRDYVSGDAFPIGTDYPSPKNVPMFNEIQVKLKYTEDIGEENAVRKLIVTITPEFWYPFPSDDNKNGPTCQTENITIGGGQSPTGGTDIWIPMALRPVSGSAPVFVAPKTQTASGFSVVSSWNDGKPKATGPWKCTLDIVSTNLNSCALLINGVKFMQPLRLKLGDDIADAIFKSSGDKMNLMSGMTIIPPNTTLVVGAEVEDPRQNHDSASWTRYKGDGAGSIGEVNEQTILALKATGIVDPEVGDYAMYCRNGPMATPGELGFIPIGTWKTIDLFSLDAAYLMHHVASADESANRNGKHFPDTLPFYTNGTVNPNTQLTNVLSSVFRETTAWGIPNWENTSQNAKALTDDDADFIAGAIVEATKKGDYDQALGKGHAFGAGSDWVSAFAPSQYKNSLKNYFSRKNVREGLVRQTWGLFRPEDNLFAIVVVAQTIQEGPSGIIGKFNENDDSILGEKRAVALVWREPFPLYTNPKPTLRTIACKEFGK